MSAVLETMWMNYTPCPPLLALTPGATMMSFGEGCEVCLLANNIIIASEIWLNFFEIFTRPDILPVIMFEC